MIYFNPRSPCGERLCLRKMEHAVKLISTHAPHAGSDPNRIVGEVDGLISTHAPHAGSDASTPSVQPALLISTHAPHAGSDRGP